MLSVAMPYGAKWQYWAVSLVICCRRFRDWPGSFLCCDLKRGGWGLLAEAALRLDEARLPLSLRQMWFEVLEVRGSEALTKNVAVREGSAHEFQGNIRKRSAHSSSVLNGSVLTGHSLELRYDHFSRSLYEDPERRSQRCKFLFYNTSIVSSTVGRSLNILLLPCV